MVSTVTARLKVSLRNTTPKKIINKVVESVDFSFECVQARQ